MCHAFQKSANKSVHEVSRELEVPHMTLQSSAEMAIPVCIQSAYYPGAESG
jgi:hypothetical protein